LVGALHAIDSSHLVLQARSSDGMSNDSHTVLRQYGSTTKPEILEKIPSSLLRVFLCSSGWIGVLHCFR